MVDVQSVTAEIKRGKKEERRKKKKETTGQKYNGLTYFTGRHNKRKANVHPEHKYTTTQNKHN